jgi:hypothetical protein
MTSAEFLAKAWKVANDKARESGWLFRPQPENYRS